MNMQELESNFIFELYSLSICKLTFNLKRDETLKRKIYWLNSDVKFSADELILADGPSSSGKFKIIELLIKLKLSFFLFI